MKTRTPNFRASIRKAITAPSHSAALTRLIEAARPVAPAPEESSKLTVTEAARILGVTRVHLSYVKHGHRRSPKLLIRYQALQHHQSIAA